MRGRFIDGNKILYFGIQMTSEWRTAAGESLQAGAIMYADMSGKVPNVRFEPHITAANGDGNTPSQQNFGNNQVQNQGTENASGVVQTIQAGGDHNSASNDFFIEIDSRSRGNALPGNTGNGMSNLTTLSGARLSVSSGNGGLGVSIDVPGQGRINQQILSRQGLHQSVQLNSNLQQIRNVTRLQLGIDRQASAGMDGQMRRAIETARGLNRL
ncbi:hypothetical protein [Methylohalomonas lacus]|nr:hypothetical protein [Methylohalomonas lacus]